MYIPVKETAEEQMITSPFLSALFYLLFIAAFFLYVGFSVQRHYNVWHDEVTVAGVHSSVCVGAAA